VNKNMLRSSGVGTLVDDNGTLCDDNAGKANIGVAEIGLLPRLR